VFGFYEGGIRCLICLRNLQFRALSFMEQQAYLTIRDMAVTSHGVKQSRFSKPRFLRELYAQTLTQ